MIRLFSSLLVGLAIGLALGLYLGWGPFPVEYLNSPVSNLDQRYKDDYTVMIAAGYQVDGDPVAAVERLRFLQVENGPAYVQEVTERYITNSNSIDDIYLLVALAEGLGRLTPLMEPYRPVELPADE